MPKPTHTIHTIRDVQNGQEFHGIGVAPDPSPTQYTGKNGLATRDYTNGEWYGYHGNMSIKYMMT